VLTGAASIAAAYLFVSVLAREDRKGHLTLSSFSALVLLLRGLGRLAAEVAHRALVAPILLPLSGVAVLLFLRRYQPRTWRRDVALALIVPSVGAAASLLLRGDLGLAALAGLLAGICLVGYGGDETGREASPLLFLVPLGLGAILRFYALAQVPNGYAEHAVAAHADLSIPYLEALRSSLHAQRLQPFLGTASHALVHEQSGFSSLIAAIGFELFGVTLTVTRLVSASLGTLTILVAYWLGRALDGVRLGLAFSFLLAVSPWHVAISRYGAQEHILSPLQFLLSLLFLVLAVNGGRVRHVLLAGLFTALAWYIYAANLVVPAIAGLFLLYRAAADPGLALRRWKKVLLGLGCFALLSYAPARQLFPRGLLLPNLRTGYQATGPILSNFATRSRMIRLETDQLFRRADDPWFSLPGGGLGVLQSTLLVPGRVIAMGALRRRRRRDLALLVLVGLPIAALPAIFAPDPSFRRLMLVTTLAALVSAFMLVRLAEAARAATVRGRMLTVITCAGALALGAAGTFSYFDRVLLVEESSSLPLSTLGGTVSGLLGRKPLVIVVPVRDNLSDARRYIKLMAYDTLLEAKRRGVPWEEFYLITSCEDPVDGRTPPAAHDSPPILVLHEAVLWSRAPCGPDFVSRLKAHYPRSAVVVARLPAPSH